MKKIILSMMTVLLVITLVSCTGKENKATEAKVTEAKGPTIEIGTSEKFDSDEINDAILEVEKKFKLKDTDLLKLWYDEKISDENIEFYMDYGRGEDIGAKPENTIVILSDFDVHSVVNEGFSDMKYEKFQWILVREEKGKPWKIEDMGY
ncbi:MAG: DUF4829 domain-containing protein [Lagierella massiliensis]|nr:DUF4829 domain-containing protein [Lagierella massiliensis]